VKAIVFRVNSPGGSALASDLIWREIELTKEKKPVVVSMGNLAASGGYYISCNADRIFAEPTTITGSIGVFGVLLNFYELSNKIGINSEQIGTNKQAIGYTPFEPLSNEFYAETKEGVEIVYNTFVDRVAKGRDMTFEEVNEIAQGRVWTGKEAVENGLVDDLGNLEDAIRAAAEIAEVENYRITNYPDYKKEFKDLFKSTLISVNKENLLKEELGEANYNLYSKLKKMYKFKGIQARLPYIIDIK
jgi:protease-4